METININGKEYSKKELLDGVYRNKHDVSGLFETLCTFPRHEAQSPTLRPMSELPATKSTYATFCNFLVEHDSKNRYYMNGYYFKSEAAGTYACVGDGDTPKPSQGWIFGEYRLIGWLPPLPNPNEIKLP